MKFGILVTLWIMMLLFNCASHGFSGDGILTSQSGGSDVSSTGKKKWTPRLNVTCLGKSLVLGDNPSCVGGSLAQKSCPGGVFKSPKDRGRSCTNRVINCTADRVCDEWSTWARRSNCCTSDSCEFEGFTYRKNRTVWKRRKTCRRDIQIEGSCRRQYSERKCVVVRSWPGGQFNNDEDGGGLMSSSSLQTIAFILAGTVLVGLLLFAAVRIRKAAAERREGRREGEIEGVDNEALGSLPPESRVQSILDTINASGRSYELHERTDSTPGRRIYVLSPASSPHENGLPPRGRVFSRTTSQLSSIAEESAEDALSHITEGTEPAEDDCVFKYDSDAINELDNEPSDCAFEENNKPASSSEAINCINDVIAMYDVENDGDDIGEALKRSSVISPTDYRKTNGVGGEDYLKSYGWRPQERPWKIEKLKDEAAKSNERISASCSTLNSIYSERSGASYYSLGRAHAETASDEGPLDPLLGEVTSLQNSKAFRSLPSVLDTSQIPDIEEVLGTDIENEHCDVIANGHAH